MFIEQLSADQITSILMTAGLEIEKISGIGKNKVSVVISPSSFEGKITITFDDFTCRVMQKHARYYEKSIGPLWRKNMYQTFGELYKNELKEYLKQKITTLQM